MWGTEKRRINYFTPPANAESLQKLCWTEKTEKVKQKYAENCSVRKPLQQHMCPSVCNDDESNMDKCHHVVAAPVVLCYCIMDGFHLEETWENNKANSIGENTYLFKLFQFHILSFKYTWVSEQSLLTEGHTLQTDKISIFLFMHIPHMLFLHCEMVYQRLLRRPHTSSATQYMQNNNLNCLGEYSCRKGKAVV